MFNYDDNNKYFKNNNNIHDYNRFSIIITMQYDIGKHKQNAKHKQVSISLNIHNSGMHVSTVKKRKHRRTHDGNDNDDDDCDGDLRSPWIQQ